MKKYVCPCGYEYDPEKGDPENGIAPGTAWEDVPEDFVCPVCKQPAKVFVKLETAEAQKPAEQQGEKWQCTVCGYIHDGAVDDDFVCPICKQGKAAFVKKA